MNAVDLLKADHARMRALFRQYEAAGEQHQKQRELVDQLFTELEVHATLEEELFYPAVRRQMDSETLEEDEDEEEEDLVAEAMEEHQEVKTLITILRALDPSDEQFQVKFLELREGVEEHVGMEEDELMPDATAALGDRLEQLGRQLEERKEQLMASHS
jgi:hypothetical protein